MKYLVQITLRFDKDDPQFVQQEVEAENEQEAFFSTMADFDRPNNFTDMNLHVHVLPLA